MFTQKIREVNQVNLRQQQSFITIAKVVACDELNNACDVQFTNNQGRIITIKSVAYQMIDPKVSSFFPLKNSLVYLQSYDNKNYLITGPYYKHDNIERNALYKTSQNKMFMKDYGIAEGSIL